MLEIKETNELPPVRRGGGRASEDRKKIIAALQSDKVAMIENIEVGKKYNAIQQRIRTAAESLGIKVTIRQVRKDDNLADLYFEGYTDEKPNVKPSKSKADT